MRFQRGLVLAACCLFVFSCERAQLWASMPDAVQDAGRHHEKTGKFSYVPPKGWTVRDFPSLKFKIAHTTPMNGFAANLNVVDGSFEGTLEEYDKANQATMKAQLDAFKVLQN